MEYVTYKDLSARYGRRKALKTLSLLEKLTQTQNDIITLNQDERFDKALQALNNINFAANSK